MTDTDRPSEEPVQFASDADRLAMGWALAAAQEAARAGEVPVGAVLVRADPQAVTGWELLATGWNRPIGAHDPTAHAEIVALRQAAASLGNYRLPGCELFVTLEPCAMCAMALMHARLRRVVFGAFDPKTGAAGSVVNLFGERALNHHTEVVGGLMASECGQLLKTFFAARRRVPAATA
jgi:tRNA(adenine34) deaminase